MDQELEELRLSWYNLDLEGSGVNFAINCHHIISLKGALLIVYSAMTNQVQLVCVLFMNELLLIQLSI